MSVITFTDTLGVSEEYQPKPASQIIPDWYKNLESYINGEKKPDGQGNSTGTAKRCMPIFDALTMGYIIVSHCDLWISQQVDQDGNTNPYYEWSNFGAVQFHSKVQLPEHPEGEGHKLAYPKWINAWSIKTPPGYSTLFIPPVHRESPIVPLPGVVDTDSYTAPVNFPFVLKNSNMEGLISAGTPIVQVIPFKREEWKMNIGGEKELIEQDKVTRKLRSRFFDSYKTQFRHKKEFR